MKRPMDIYHYCTIDSAVLNCLTSTLNLKTYYNFNPLNVPIDDHRAFISKDDVSYGSLERMPISNSYIKCNYSTSNTIKFIKKIGDSISNTSQPKRALITIPLLNNKSLDTITKYAQNYTLLGIIPEGSMYLNPSDHWFDSEKVNLLNKVPIAICLYCNDLSLQIHPIQPQHFEKIEYVLNHNLLPNMKTKIILPRPPTIEPIRTMETTIATNSSKSEDMIPKDIIYTDASIRIINDTKVSGIGIWCGPNDPRNISQRIVSKYSLIDINYCELIAIYVALINSHSKQEVIVYTDSLFALKLIEEGSRNIDNIQKVKYKEIVSMIVYLVYNRMKPSYFMKVSAHQGYIGNENADIMAKMSLHSKDAIYIDDLKALQYTKRWSSHFMMIRKWWI
jgi:ribonuclease HI